MVQTIGSHDELRDHARILQVLIRADLLIRMMIDMKIRIHTRAILHEAVHLGGMLMLNPRVLFVNHSPERIQLKGNCDNCESILLLLCHACPGCPQNRPSC